MNFALMEEILEAHQTADFDRVDALLTVFLKDIDLTVLPNDLLDRYYALFEDEAAAVPAESVERVRAAVERKKEEALAAEADQPPRLIDCLELGQEEADDPCELGVDAATFARLRDDARRITSLPQSLRDFATWLAQGGIRLPETSTQRLYKTMRRGYMQLGPSQQGLAIPFQAARKDIHRP